MKNVVFGNLENIDVIGKQVGMNLEVVDTEVPVGDFRLDILCKDVNSGKTVAIMNTLGALEFSHIGKAFECAVSMKVDAVILIAEGICKGVANSIDKLNDSYFGKCQFWAFKANFREVINTNKKVQLTEF